MKLPGKFRSKLCLLLALATAGISYVTLSSVRVSAEEAAAPAGLTGILPDVVPAGLLQDEFQTLGDSWQVWANETAAEVAKLYEDSSNIAAQRETIAALQKRIHTMDSALADTAYRPIFDALATLRGRLARRVDVASAILDTLEMNPEAAHQARLEELRSQVVNAVDNLDAYLAKIQNGGAWTKYVKAAELRKLTAADGAAEVVNTVHSRLADSNRFTNEEQRKFVNGAQFVRLKDSLGEYLELANATVKPTDTAALRGELKSLVAALEANEEYESLASARDARKAYSKVRELSADGGARIADALSSHYFNYNLRIVASENLLNKVAGYAHKDTGPVDDFILGAKVDGTQWTTGRVGIDLKPNNDLITFYMTFSGHTQTSTQGVTDQATVFTSGYHTFAAQKAINFDGDRFSTAPATIAVNANNTTTGARTTVSGVPILGSIADDYAVGEARNRKARSEAIAADKLERRLLPEFNKGVDDEFGNLSKQLEEKLIPKLHDSDLYPSARSFRSEETSLWASTRLMNEDELAGDTPTFTATSDKGVVIHLHESLLNNSLDRLHLGGQSLTEDELTAKLADSFSSLLGRKVDLSSKKTDGEASDPTKFVFPQEDPLRIRIEDGELTLILRTGLQPEDGDTIPTQIISVPLTFNVVDDGIEIQAGAVGVAPAEAPDNRFAQIARAGVVKSKIEKALPNRKVDRAFKLDRENGGPVTLAITQIKRNAGWLSIVIE
ncbi:hypothetical protein GC176_16550 [bacterium]|nr:hypothetical protein [bacterium]